MKGSACRPLWLRRVSPAAAGRSPHICSDAQASHLVPCLEQTHLQLGQVLGKQLVLLLQGQAQAADLG